MATASEKVVCGEREGAVFHAARERFTFFPPAQSAGGVFYLFNMPPRPPNREGGAAGSIFLMEVYPPVFGAKSKENAYIFAEGKENSRKNKNAARFGLTNVLFFYIMIGAKIIYGRKSFKGFFL